MRVTIRIVACAVLWTVAGYATAAVTTRITLYQGMPYLDVEVTVHNKPADPWPEAGWICLPLKIDQPQFRLGRLGSIVDPAKDIVPGANHRLFAINTGLTVADPAGHGVGICPIDHPLVSLDTPGLWKYSRDFVPKKSAVFVNIFNNQWTTNFRLWNEGTWTSRVRLWAADTSHSTNFSLVHPSLEARYPLLATATEGPAGKLLPSQAGLHVGQADALVTTFGPNPDGKGTLLRLWEHSGCGDLCEVTLPAGLKAKTAQPVDLRGQPLGQPMQLETSKLLMKLEPFAPASFVLED